MTRSELLQIGINLSMAAMKEPSQENGYHGNANEDIRALNALGFELFLAEQKRSEGCEYCKHFGKPSAVMWDVHDLKSIGENESHKSFIGISILTRKNEGQLSVFSQSADNKQNKITAIIKYCPNCGRDMTEGESV